MMASLDRKIDAKGVRSSDHDQGARRGHGDDLKERPGDETSVGQFNEEYFVDEAEAFGIGGFGDDGERSREEKLYLASRGETSRPVPRGPGNEHSGSTEHASHGGLLASRQSRPGPRAPGAARPARLF
jgi:hypothetical protein